MVSTPGGVRVVIVFTGVEISKRLAVGGIGCYLDSVRIVPATTASGAVTIFDGSTAIVSVPAAAALGQSAPYCMQLGIRATNTSTGFKITTGASVSVIAVGKFST